MPQIKKNLIKKPKSFLAQKFTASTNFSPFFQQNMVTKKLYGQKVAEESIEFGYLVDAKFLHFKISVFKMFCFC